MGRPGAQDWPALPSQSAGWTAKTCTATTTSSAGLPTPSQRCEPPSPVPAFELFDVRQALLSPSAVAKLATAQQQAVEGPAEAATTAAPPPHGQQQAAARPRRPSSMRALQLVQRLGEDEADPDFCPRAPQQAVARPRAAATSGGGGTPRADAGRPSRYRGVVWHKSNSKWEARIYEGGRQKFLGYFVNEDAAAMAYDDYAMRLHGNLAKLNFPHRYAGGQAAVPGPSSSAAPAGPGALPPLAGGGRQGKRGGGGRRAQPVKGSSRFRGVSWNSNCCKWRAQVWKGSEVFHLGYFENEIAAARTYDAAVLRIRGPDAPTNFPASEYQAPAGGAGSAFPETGPAAPEAAAPRSLPPRAAAAGVSAATAAAAAADADVGARSAGWGGRRGAWAAKLHEGPACMLVGAYGSEAEAARAYHQACLEQLGGNAHAGCGADTEVELAAVALTWLSRGARGAASAGLLQRPAASASTGAREAAAEAAADSRDGDLASPSEAPPAAGARLASASAEPPVPANQPCPCDGATPQASAGHSAGGANAPSSSHSSGTVDTAAANAPLQPDAPAAARPRAGSAPPPAAPAPPAGGGAAERGSAARRGMSQFMGVSWDRRKQRWFSQIQQAGKRRFLGASLKLHGPSAPTNFEDSAANSASSCYSGDGPASSASQGGDAASLDVGAVASGTLVRSASDAGTPSPAPPAPAAGPPHAALLRQLGQLQEQQRRCTAALHLHARLAALPGGLRALAPRLAGALPSAAGQPAVLPCAVPLVLWPVAPAAPSLALAGGGTAAKRSCPYGASEVGTSPKRSRVDGSGAPVAPAALPSPAPAEAATPLPLAAGLVPCGAVSPAACGATAVRC
eukprot:scaffold7.g3573.t1